jgi:hypothetical protein
MAGWCLLLAAPNVLDSNLSLCPLLRCLILCVAHLLHVSLDTQAMDCTSLWAYTSMKEHPGEHTVNSIPRNSHVSHALSSRQLATIKTMMPTRLQGKTQNVCGEQATKREGDGPGRVEGAWMLVSESRSQP